MEAWAPGVRRPARKPPRRDGDGCGQCHRTRGGGDAGDEDGCYARAQSSWSTGVGPTRATTSSRRSPGIPRCMTDPARSRRSCWRTTTTSTAHCGGTTASSRGSPVRRSRRYADRTAGCRWHRCPCAAAVTSGSSWACPRTRQARSCRPRHWRGRAGSTGSGNSWAPLRRHRGGCSCGCSRSSAPSGWRFVAGGPRSTPTPMRSITQPPSWTGGRGRSRAGPRCGSCRAWSRSWWRSPNGWAARRPTPTSRRATSTPCPSNGC